MIKLKRDLISSDFHFPPDLKVQPTAATLPERVIQFGEGNFLRAFVDWMFQQLNAQGLFNGRVVVVQPIAAGLAAKLNEQDGLYTIILRGLRDRKPVEQKEIVSSISRGINPYTQWQEYLQCAENPFIEFAISNTTEAGIVYDENDKLNNAPPVSFPGKLTAYLYHRFRYFNGDPAKGMVMLPCELIDRNGDNLKAAVLKLAEKWDLPQQFREWIKRHNQFLNTLVDRVVTGYPKDEISGITEQLGYEDALVDTGELFHLWVIEGPRELSEKLPFAKIGLNVIWTEDMTPYRTRKVRILNGAHTSSVPAAFLYGLDTVGEMMDHAVLGKYVRQIIYNEIIPSIDLDKVMLTEFANAVVERFQNPYIRHYLLSILLNSSAKFKARVLPSILEYRQLNHTLPEKLTFSLAALIAVYQQGSIDGSVMKASRGKDDFVMQDDLPVLRFFAAAWSKYDGSPAGAAKLAGQVLTNKSIWGQDLNGVPGLQEKVGGYLYRISSEGIQKVIAQLIGEE
ncbi:MAG: tagaturonate reductase [Veillonellales bacterium]